LIIPLPSSLCRSWRGPHFIATIHPFKPLSIRFIHMPVSFRLPVRALACALIAGISVNAGAQKAPPTTFGTTVGNAVLCLDHIDNAYFYTYLSNAFGPAYKHEGGAFWFRTEAKLWDVPVTEVIVSDDTSPLTFVGVVADTTPEKLEEAATRASGLHYVKKDASAFPVRESRPGSKIVYFKTMSKVFCARYKAPQPPLAR
jgi:hypothetical protein